MAKSLRSKSKRSFRSKKRESGKYAAAAAARLDRLNAKLVVLKDRHPRPATPPLDAAEDMAVEEQTEGLYDSEAFFAYLGFLHPWSVTAETLAQRVALVTVGPEERH